MESQEDGCTHRSECVNFGERCEVCSAHYSNEFSDTEECEDCKYFDEMEALPNNACKRSPKECKFKRR